MKRWHILAVSLAIVLPGSVALACSLADEPAPGVVLGYARYHSVPAEEIDPVPSNVAGAMADAGGDAFSSAGVPLWRHPEGEPVMTLGGTIIPRTDIVDSTPPSRPTITSAQLMSSGGGCGAYGCGRLNTFHFEIDATDDIAPAERLTYAVYFTDDESAPAGEPDKLLVHDWDGQLWGWGSESDEGARIFAWVRALDQAGNASELSEPVRVDTGGSGCSAGPRAGGLLPVAFVLLLFLRRQRRTA
ncbi:MAG: hypothetical protein JJ863_04385 [Deltaproteobacteria bacterium]|nr:hypothetical protein [Deltaproteobacteria bacterium]